MNSFDQIQNWAADHAVLLPETFSTQLTTFKELIYLWNTKHNLTRIDQSDFETLHVIDSLTVATRWQPSASTDTVIDIGTGAGFPGIPLALLYPEIQFTLADKSRKRIVFLEQVIASLSLKNVQPVHGRLEDLATLDGYAETFNLVTSRALAPMATLLPLAAPFAVPGGAFEFLKSHTVFEELEQIPQIQREALGVVAIELHPYVVSGRSEEDYVFSAKKV